MAAYEFTCAEHGRFEIAAAIGSAPSTPSCPDCGEPARRVFSAPMLGRVDAATRSTLERAERSGHEPDVVSSPPPNRDRSAQPRYTHDPAHQRLPKP